MKAFKATGFFSLGKLRERQKFSIEIAADNEAGATEQIYSTLGSHQKVNRKQIEISEMRQLSADEIVDPVVKHLVGGAQ